MRINKLFCLILGLAWTLVGLIVENGQNMITTGAVLFGLALVFDNERRKGDA